jgi:hypothetical protein
MTNFMPSAKHSQFVRSAVMPGLWWSRIWDSGVRMVNPGVRNWTVNPNKPPLHSNTGDG